MDIKCCFLSSLYAPINSYIHLWLIRLLVSSHFLLSRIRYLSSVIKMDLLFFFTVCTSEHVHLGGTTGMSELQYISESGFLFFTDTFQTHAFVTSLAFYDYQCP